MALTRWGAGQRRATHGWRWLGALVTVGVGALGLAGCVADAPPVIGVATRGDGRAVVSWQAPLSSPEPIAAYAVTPWIGSIAQAPVVFESTATLQVVGGLTNGIEYRFTVRAVNTRGHESASSAQSNAVTPSPSAAPPPANLGPPTYVGNLQEGLALRDVNGDDLPDLIAGWSSSSVMVSLGPLVCICFYEPHSYPIGGTWNWASDAPDTQAGDMNSDGHADLLVSRSDGLAMLPGDGSGGFGAPSLVSADLDPWNVDAGDLDGDGDLDVVVGREGGVSPWTFGEITVLLGDGAGGMGPPIDYVTGGTIGTIVKLADMDDDGRLDVVASTGSGVAVALGDGSGGLGPLRTFPTTVSTPPQDDGPAGFDTGDVNADGRLDVVAAGRVLLGDGHGGLSRAAATGRIPSASSTFALADLNGDGFPDVVSGWQEPVLIPCNPLYNCQYRYGLRALMGNGTGGFGSWTELASGPVYEPITVLSADLENDGDLDLLIGGDGTADFQTRTPRTTAILNTSGPPPG